MRHFLAAFVGELVKLGAKPKVPKKAKPPKPLEVARAGAFAALPKKTAPTKQRKIKLKFPRKKLG